MARPKGIPKLCHHIASGRAVVRIDGKDHYCGRWDNRRDRPTPEAQATYQRLIAERLAGAHHDGLLETIAELIAAYWPIVMTEHQRNGKPTGKAFEFRSAFRYLMLYAKLPINDFGPLKLKAVREAMIADGLARSTINAQINRIRMAFRWAGENELIDPLQPDRLAVVRGLRKGKGGVEPRKRRPITWERVAPIEPYVPRAVWAMVQLHWHTGMRSGELVMLRSCDIDMSGDIWIYRPQQHKTEHLDHIRAIAIGPKAQDILRPWLRADLDAYLFQARESEQLRNTTRRDNRQTPKWPSHDPDHRRRKRGRKGKANRRPGEHYTTSSYYRAVKRAILAASIDAWCVDHGDDSHWSGAYRQWLRAKPKRLRREIDAWKREHGSEAMHSEAFRGFLASRDWHPHQLRHTFATRARSEFEEWDPVRAALGHTSPQTTIVYARLDERKAAKVAKKIG